MQKFIFVVRNYDLHAIIIDIGFTIANDFIEDTTKQCLYC